jgi:hypothetical protein
VWSFNPGSVRPFLSQREQAPIAANVGWLLPCPSRSGRLEAEQDALVPVGEAVENALFSSSETFRMRI